MGVLRKTTKDSVGIDGMRPRYETGNSQYEVELLNTRPLLLVVCVILSCNVTYKGGKHMSIKL
jgi:hypothetical protein